MLGDDVESVNRTVRRPEPDAPDVVAATLRADQDKVVHTQKPFGLAERPLGGLDREGVRAATAVPVEVDAARRERREQARDVARLDATVVRAMRERNDVPCEAVAADVGRLPHLAGRPSPAERVVQRPALAGAAAVALAVRAHDDKRVSDGPQRRAVAGERARQVDAVEVVLVLDLEPEKTLPAGLRRRQEHAPEALDTPLGLLHEEQARGAERLELLPKMRLEPRREEAPAEDVATPGAAVLDQDPVVDPARRRAERLLARPRDGGAEGPSSRRSVVLRARSHASQGSLL